LLLSEREKKNFIGNLDALIRLSKKYGLDNNLRDFYHLYSYVISKKQENKTKEEAENENISETKCFMPWSDIIVAEDGRVGPCLAFYFEKLNVKDDALDKIWFGKDFENIRKSILGNNLGFFCRNCRQWWGPEEANLIKSQLEDHELNRTFNNLVKKRKYDEAISYLKKKIKDSQKTALLYRNLGECYIKKKDYKSALCHLSKALELEPELEWTNFSLGKAYFLMKDYDNAVKFLKKNLSVQNQNPLSYHHSELLLTKLNKINKLNKKER